MGSAHAGCLCIHKFSTDASPPSDVTAVRAGLTSITVNWTASSDAAGYRISYTSDSGSGSETVSDGSTETHTLTGLVNGETYNISIVGTASSPGPPRAPVEAGTVGLSKSMIVLETVRTFCVSLSAPSAAVLSETTSPSSTAITITGSVPSDTVVTGYVVDWQRDTCPGEGEMAMRIGTISEAGVFPNSYPISGLEPGNRYTITVTVSNAAGTAPASNSVTGTTLETGERETLSCSCNVVFFSSCVLLSSQCWSSLSHTWYCHSQKHHSPVGGGALSPP